MKLMHWSSKPIDAVHDVQQKPEPRHKPRGLWLSDEAPGRHGWASWCSVEMPGWLHPHVYEIELAAEANVLVLSDVGDIYRFHHEYTRDSGYSRRDVDWRAVAEKHDGIIITPYQWSCRLDGDVSDWYYSWDCASGCIWKAHAVAAIRSVNMEVAA